MKLDEAPEYQLTFIGLVGIQVNFPWEKLIAQTKNIIN